MVKVYGPELPPAVSAKFFVVVTPAVTVTDALLLVNPLAEAVAVKVPVATVMV
jgi:hypothetical protein